MHKPVRSTEGRPAYRRVIEKNIGIQIALIENAMAAQLGVRAHRPCSGLNRSVGAPSFQRTPAARRNRVCRTFAASLNGASKSATLSESTGGLLKTLNPSHLFESAVCWNSTEQFNHHNNFATSWFRRHALVKQQVHIRVARRLAIRVSAAGTRENYTVVQRNLALELVRVTEVSFIANKLHDRLAHVVVLSRFRRY